MSKTTLRQELYNLKMFDLLNMQEDSPIDYAIRVPGGWIFKFTNVENHQTDSVFVPLPKELSSRKV